MFKEIKPNKIFQDVVEQIEDAIVGGELEVGDKLPPERELKETFSVSRGTLREALRVLEEKNLIDIQLGAGGGAIVQEVTPNVGTDSLSLLLRSQDIPLASLKEVRMDMEASIARLAAERAGAEGLDRLQNILRLAKESLDDHSGWRVYVRADAEFHMELARMTGNPVYEYVQTAIHENINRYYAEFLEHDESVLCDHYKDLCDIVEAVAAGDGKRAADKMQQHLGRMGKGTIKNG